MKTREKQSARDLSAEAIYKKIAELERTILKASVERHGKQAKNTRRVRAIKNDISILKTFVRQKKG